MSSLAAVFPYRCRNRGICPSVCWMFGVLGVRPSTRCCTSGMNECWNRCVSQHLGSFVQTGCVGSTKGLSVDSLAGVSGLFVT